MVDPFFKQKYRIMEKYLIRKSPQKDREVKYLSKYCSIKRTPLQDTFIPSIVSALESPPTHMEIIEKCPIQLNQIKKIRQLRIQEDKENDGNTSIDEGVLKRFKILKKVFKRTHRAEEIFIQNQAKKDIKKCDTSHESRRLDDKTKFCAPPFGYYDNNYSQVERRIPSLDISKKPKKTFQIRSCSPSIEVKYNAVHPRPISFNMSKQLSRDKGQNNKHLIQPDIRMLQAEYQFNCQQQKKYPMSIPSLKLKMSLDKKTFPYSMSQINHLNVQILKKYNFNQNDKKFAFFKKIAAKKQ